MKKITVSLPDEVYRRIRVKAAERGASVSALLRDFLKQLAEGGESEFERRKRLQDEVIASIREFRAGDRRSRDEVHNPGVQA